MNLYVGSKYVVDAFVESDLLKEGDIVTCIAVDPVFNIYGEFIDQYGFTHRLFLYDLLEEVVE